MCDVGGRGCVVLRGGVLRITQRSTQAFFCEKAFLVFTPTLFHAELVGCKCVLLCLGDHVTGGPADFTCLLGLPDLLPGALFEEVRAALPNRTSFLQREVSSEPVPAGGAGPDRAGIRQPSRGPFTHQATFAHPASLQGGEPRLEDRVSHGRVSRQCVAACQSLTHAGPDQCSPWLGGHRVYGPLQPPGPCL